MVLCYWSSTIALTFTTIYWMHHGSRFAHLRTMPHLKFTFASAHLYKVSKLRLVQKLRAQNLQKLVAQQLSYSKEISEYARISFVASKVAAFSRRILNTFKTHHCNCSLDPRCGVLICVDCDNELLINCKSLSKMWSLIDFALYVSVRRTLVI